MIAEIGQFLLIFALVLSLAQALSPLGARFLRISLQPCLPRLSIAMGLMVTAAFACLIICYARSDFTVLTVVMNSHSLKPMWAKITAAWGNHEGSMVLWLWVLTFLGMILGFIARKRSHALHHDALVVLGIVCSGFLLFILFTSNPFTRVFPAPVDGEDLNPLLQDIGLIIHPPLLYLGYVGSGIVFAFGAAAMARGEINSTFARTIQPWLLVTWASLSAGIAVGSWWAYRELGWGGWWYWDPVENVSLMPWLCATALLHLNVVLEKRGEMPRLVALLTIITFSLSLTGTFIVRSGLITSVHAFASDPTRGIFMLGLIGAVIMGGLALYTRMQMASASNVPPFFSRQGQILFSSIILLTLASTIVLAILYPLALTLLKLPSISVGPPYFYAVFVPLVLPLAACAAAAPFLAWDNASRRQIIDNLLWVALPCIAVCMCALAVLQPYDAITILATSLSAALLLNMARFAAKSYRNNALTLRHAATLLGHSGFALLLVCAALNAQLKTHLEAPMRVSESYESQGVKVTLNDIELGAKDNFLYRRAQLTISKDGRTIGNLAPETRYYPVRSQETTESAVAAHWFYDIYAVIGRAEYHASAKDAHKQLAKDSLIGVRIYIMPMQRLIWIAFAMIALSGVIGAAGHIRKRAACA